MAKFPLPSVATADKNALLGGESVRKMICTLLKNKKTKPPGKRGVLFFIGSSCAAVIFVLKE